MHSAIPRSPSLLPHEYKLHRMITLEATTPQLRAVQVWADAVRSRNFSNAGHIFSKDFTLKTFPKSTEHPDLTKEGYIQKYCGVLAMFSKAEVVFHEVIEAPGKVVLQLTLSFTTADDVAVDYDSVLILSFVDEDGEAKVIEAKDFSDPEKRSGFHAESAKVLAKEGIFA